MSERLAIDGGTPVRTRPFGAHHEFGDEDIAALAEVVRSGNIGKGQKVDRFERAFAARHGVKYGVSVTSGTAAMHTCVGAINPDPGDEIIVTPWTSGGSIIGALWQNCVPVFADVDDTYTIAPQDVEAKITPRTRAIIAVHLFGNPCDMGALRDIARRHGLFLIEDCCQAHFAEYQGQIVGTLGDIAGFSFGGKHLSAGMGGIVLTSNESLWERAILFADAALPRANGPYAGRPYANYFLANNYRLTDLIAAVLLTQFGKVDGYIECKVEAARRINDLLADIPEITPQRVRPGDRHSYWVLGWTLDTEQLGISAWAFAAAVTAEGVSMSGPYIGSGKEGPLYRNPFLADPACYGQTRFPFAYQRERPLDYRLVECPNGEALMIRGVNIQMRPTFTAEDIEDIATAIRKVVVACRERSARPVTAVTG
jgi:dTDP-4-amino-4,6-dideoxygalactose transaminase